MLRQAVQKNSSDDSSSESSEEKVPKQTKQTKKCPPKKKGEDGRETVPNNFDSTQKKGSHEPQESNNKSDKKTKATLQK